MGTGPKRAMGPNGPCAQTGPGPVWVLGPNGPWAQWALGPMGPGRKWALGPNGLGQMGRAGPGQGYSPRVFEPFPNCMKIWWIVTLHRDQILSRIFTKALKAERFVWRRLGLGMLLVLDRPGETRGTLHFFYNIKL